MDTQLIQQLRKETGAGIMDVKKALQESKGDLEKAREILRKIGAVIAAKKSQRETHDGLIISYIHAGGKIGVLVKIYCETDFVAKTDEFQKLGNDLAMHIAAMNPEYLSKEDIPKEVIEVERRIYKEQLNDVEKPKDIIKKIMEGKIDKFATEVSLLEQSFVKNPDQSIRDLIEEYIAKLGENIQVGDFVRYEL